jgi:hypothetical protein
VSLQDADAAECQEDPDVHGGRVVGDGLHHERAYRQSDQRASDDPITDAAPRFGWRWR